MSVINNQNGNGVVAVFDKLVRIKQVSEMCSVSRATIYRYIKQGSFPKPIHISERCIAWRTSAIDAWIKHKENK